MPSGSKKQQIRYQQQYQDVVMAEQLDDIVLRRGPASTPALPDRLVLSSLDSRRLRVKAGDWLLISGSQPEKESRVNQENEDCPRRDSGGLRLMLRAWPGSNVPQGTAVGGGPLLSGQFFGKRRQGEDVNVSVRALPATAKWLAASKVVLRVVPEGDGRESTGGGARETSRRDTPSQSSVAPVLFWKARLHSILVGQLVFPGLRLAFASLGQGVSFEVVEVRAARGEMAGGAESMPDLAKLTLKEVKAPQEPRVGLDLESVCEVLPGTRVAVAGLFPHGKAETATGWRGEPSGAKWGERLVEGGWWASVGGLEAVVEELRQGVEQSLDSLHVFLDRGLRPARGFLLVGPSGTGKTTLLRAAAEYFGRGRGYHVMRVAGPEVVGRLVGETESRLRRAFREARARAPTVMVLDEVEALCPRREAASSDLDRRMVATLLALLDGFQGLDRVVVLAATSRPQALDPALRRPGRLDRELEVGVPGEAARGEILRVLLAGTGLESEAAADRVLQRVASRAHGFVGADLLLVCKEAAMLAVRRGMEAAGGGAGRDSGDPVRMTGEDLAAALALVRPSALREVAVEVPRVQWGDIGGMDRVKQSLRECVEWPLTRPEAFVRMGIAPPKGVLLYGPPGCSKTLMARALATESGMNFLAVKGPELLSKWLGESEKALQGLFKKARAAAPTVVFFDEVDALAGRRGDGEDCKASERVLSQLLTELDGVQPLRRVVVVAATNRPDLLDPALLRPGRIDRRVYVPPPDLASRLEILKIALRGVPTESPEGEASEGAGVDLEELARRTEGFSGAEVVALSREAALCAVEEDPVHARLLRGRHFEQALAGWQRQIAPRMLEYYRRYAGGS